MLRTMDALNDQRRDPRVPPATAGHRALAMLVAAGLLGLLAVAAWLDPAAEGVGTHRQLGMHACAVLTTTGRPCVTCGMTTAMSHAADGNFAGSFRAQPFGLALGVLAAVGVWVSLHVAATGSHLGPLVRRAMGARGVGVVVALLLVSWGYKAWNLAAEQESVAVASEKESR